VAKDEEVKCLYLGAAHATAMQPVEPKPIPPAPKFARDVALCVLHGDRGRYRTCNHFSEQMAERRFDVFDIEYVIRNGEPIGQGEYSEEHNDHKYTFRGIIDGTGFDAVFSLSAKHDFIKSPLITLITGCWKTKSGKRTRTL
jgi:hypothetical protein